MSIWAAKSEKFLTIYKLILCVKTNAKNCLNIVLHNINCFPSIVLKKNYCNRLSTIKLLSVRMILKITRDDIQYSVNQRNFQHTFSFLLYSFCHVFLSSHSWLLRSSLCFEVFKTILWRSRQSNVYKTISVNICNSFSIQFFCVSVPGLD